MVRRQLDPGAKRPSWKSCDLRSVLIIIYFYLVSHTCFYVLCRSFNQLGTSSLFLYKRYSTRNPLAHGICPRPTLTSHQSCTVGSPQDWNNNGHEARQSRLIALYYRIPTHYTDIEHSLSDHWDDGSKLEQREAKRPRLLSSSNVVVEYARNAFFRQPIRNLGWTHI